jgi:pantoate--beta-alanine ligase
VTEVLTTRAELAKARAELPGRVGVVMTMGALHAGHAMLLRVARAECDHVLATIFVNPLQFGPSEDFSRYPRTLEADLAVLRQEGADAVFVPSVEEIYPNAEPAVTVRPGPLGTVLEGAHRPGHFDGVLTVVLKLLNLTGTQLAYFGEKDYQQLTLIRAMVAELNVPTTIVTVPTVREPDGLALSSRNRYLSDVERTQALALSRALRAGVVAGSRGAQAVLTAARRELDRATGVAVDYLELTDPDLGPPPVQGPARLLVAARLGATRLIDTMGLVLREPELATYPTPPYDE